MQALGTHRYKFLMLIYYKENTCGRYNKNTILKSLTCMYAGMFCHHVIAVLEHLRLDRIPERYILQRYTTHPEKEPDYNRRDYKKEIGRAHV